MEVAATVNYVVVALGDSEQSISAAVNIFNYVRRNRVDISRFKIFVRSYSSYYEPHMRDIADHYNQVGTPAFAEHIVIFGSAASIYTFGNIVESRFEAEGRLYNRAYCTVNNRLGTKDEWALRRLSRLHQALHHRACLRRQQRSLVVVCRCACA